MRVIGESQVRQWAIEAARGREDFVYNPTDRPVCQYIEGAEYLGLDRWDVSEATPSCLWGHVFLQQDVVNAEWLMNNGRNDAEIRNLADAFESAGVVFTEDALEFMTASQRSQDCGDTWGEAIDKATTRNDHYAEGSDF